MHHPGTGFTLWVKTPNNGEDFLAAFPGVLYTAPAVRAGMGGPLLA